MKDLNNSQVILLAILVSFVTSMATGIATVSLMQEAPVSVTQTINRVVERTVERVIPGSTTVKEVSKVISVDDLVVEAVKKASPSVVTLYGAQSTSTQPGFFVAGDYLITIDNSSAHTDTAYILKDKNGAPIALKFIKADEKNGLAVYAPLLPAGTTFNASLIAFSQGEVAPGQTSIALSTDGSGDRVLSVGIITNVAGSTTTDQTIRTNAITTASVGGPLIDIHGELIGIAVQERTALGLHQVRQLLDSIK